LSENFFKNKYLPAVILLLIGLIAGITLFRDFGASWDEPDLYAYADQSIRAYSIQDRINGQFSLDSLLGPDNLRLYGPAYLVFGKVLVNGIKSLAPGAMEIDLWHLVNFLVFVFGTIILYFLLLRWIKPPAAFSSALLFFTQPVLFGISWIDPKDIPFMVLFICSVYFGLMLVDHVALTLNKIEISPSDHSVEVALTSKEIRRWFWIAGGLIALSLLLLGFSPSIENIIRQTIVGMNGRAAGDPIRSLFSNLAQNANQVPLDAYAEKAVFLFRSSSYVLFVITLVLAAFTASIHFFPKWIGAFTRNCRMVFSSLFQHGTGRSIQVVLLASFFLGISTTVRVLAPLAGLFIAVELVRKAKWKSIPVLGVYGILSIVFAYVAWPYMWQNTISRFSEVFFHMADNPVGVGVLFQGTVYESKDLPIQYLPVLLGITITIPVIIFSLWGMVVRVVKFFRERKLSDSFLMAAWFFIPLAYVLIFRPAMYDNYRHFLFILPPVFYFCSIALEWIFSRTHKLIQILIVLVTLLPGLVGLVHLHPYEYSYYNALAGGLYGAAGKYETDYWLTCYRELTLQINDNEADASNLFVAFMPSLVKYYSAPRFEVLKANDPSYPAGSLLLLPMRREASTQFPDLPVAYRVVKDGVSLCLARRVE
jgi:hypothetical protein